MIRKTLAAVALTLAAFGLSQFALAQHHGGCCEDDCGGPKICVPKTETKKVAKPYYDCKCVQFCLPPKCQLGGHGHGHGCGGCGSCDDCGSCAECCPPRTKKVLIKKIKIEEECVTSCELKDGCADTCETCRPRHRLLNLHRHDCENGCCPANSGDGPVIIPPGAEPIAPPKNIP